MIDVMFFLLVTCMLASLSMQSLNSITVNLPQGDVPTAGRLCALTSPSIPRQPGFTAGNRSVSVGYGTSFSAARPRRIRRFDLQQASGVDGHH
jgi:hypothetical protein